MKLYTVIDLTINSNLGRMKRFFLLRRPVLWFTLPCLLGNLAIFGGGACQSAPSRTESAPPPVAADKTPSLEARVLARHDSLMMLTDQLFALRQRLAAGGAALPADPALRARFGPRLNSATRATRRADDAMMDWMHAYHRPAADTAPDSATAYFLRQLRVLGMVDTLTHRALDSATAVLRALEHRAAHSN